MCVPAQRSRASQIFLFNLATMSVPSIFLKNLLKVQRSRGRNRLHEPVYADSPIPEEFRHFLPEDTEELQPGCQDFNGLWYCKRHARDTCYQCTIVNHRGVIMDLFYRNGAYIQTYGPPKRGGQSKYPMMNATNDHVQSLLGLRWLQMQQLLYGDGEAGKLAPDTSQLVRFPTLGDSLETKKSGVVLQEKLLCYFGELQGIAVSRRYHFANQSRILLQDYDTFKQAAVLFDQELDDVMTHRWGINPTPDGRPIDSKFEHAYKLKAQASFLNTFAFFLDIKTIHSFWRMTELTVEAFLQHVKTYDEKIDGDTVILDKSKRILLQWVAHFFWSVQLAQYRLDRLQHMQHTVYQRGVYPFYPYVLEALASPKAKLDIHLIILKLGKCAMYDFPLIRSLFDDFKQACSISEQMKSVNEQIMACIEELSERFDAMQLLVRAARLVAPEREIKAALASYPFERYCKEVNSKFQDVVAIIDMAHAGRCNPRTEGNLSFVHKLMVRENSFRRAHMDWFVNLPGLSHTITNDIFDSFKARYMSLNRDIRREWRQEERSLLPPSVVKRFRDSRRFSKMKNSTQTTPRARQTASAAGDEQVEIVEARYVPKLDPWWSWHRGTASEEKYLPPEVRQKIKTRNQPSLEVSSVLDPSPSISKLDTSSVPPIPERYLSRLKESDLVTRDILWRKIKGNLKWSDLLQFLTHLGYGIINKTGSIRKVYDPDSGAWTDLHRPHPTENCRPDQTITYREHFEDFLNLRYEQLLTPGEKTTG